MASLDFANMSKQDLVVFRRKAIKAGERPSAKNNYFTVTLSAVANKQPDDWVPTALFKTWCEHHGPSNHATAECHNADGMRRKPASQLKAEENARRLKKYMEHIEKTYVAMKIQERRAKQAAKRYKNPPEGQQ